MPRVFLWALRFSSPLEKSKAFHIWLCSVVLHGACLLLEHKSNQSLSPHSADQKHKSFPYNMIYSILQRKPKCNLIAQYFKINLTFQKNCLYLSRYWWMYTRALWPQWFMRQLSWKLHLWLSTRVLPDVWWGFLLWCQWVQRQQWKMLTNLHQWQRRVSCNCLGGCDYIGVMCNFLFYFVLFLAFL